MLISSDPLRPGFSIRSPSNRPTAIQLSDCVCQVAGELREGWFSAEQQLVILAEIVCGKLFQTLSGKGDAGRRLQERQHVRGDKESDRADLVRVIKLS